VLVELATELLDEQAGAKSRFIYEGVRVMSSGLDLSQFYETFFDEADELLAQMEQLLLELDLVAVWSL